MTTALEEKTIEVPQSESYANRETWLEARQSTIGATDVAVILGLSHYKSAYTLWAEKTGRLTPQKENLAMKLGLMLEPIVADLYRETTGREPLVLEDYQRHSRNATPWLCATPDRLLYYYEGKIKCRMPLELKTSGNDAAWKEGIPMAYQAQVQIQMHCMMASKGALAVLIGNREFRHWDLERNDRFLKAALPKIEEFYDRIQNDDPPSVDGSNSTAETLTLLHPKDNGDTRIMPSWLPEVDARRDELKEQIAALEDERKELDARIKEAIGDCTLGVYDNIKYSYKTQTRKAHIEVPFERESALIEQGIEYEVTGGAEFRVLRRSTAKTTAKGAK